MLSSGGRINIGGGQVITLTQHAAYQPDCAPTPLPDPIDPTLVNQTVIDSTFGVREPFYQSTDPTIYAIAAATAVSYMLVLMLFITPRTFFVGGVGGGGGFLGNGGMIGRSYGNNPVIGVGSRPWLQKAATLAVAVSLTIVTADTFKWAERQYEHGYQDAMELSYKVVDGLEIRIVRVISETFLWLAQAQTLIRLFPRHKEKLVIKWTAFGLITLELIFSILNFFADEGGHAHPRKFNNAIPAMDYLFALTLNLCYAAFVFYYAMCKRRYAFYHTNMRNMPLVALLSLVAVLIPVIFFILDLSKPEVSGWGGYVRWVGAAAASVVVWEWVERIEALERDEKKDGILGREIFDGDEMLDATQLSEYSWNSSGRKKDRRDNGGGGVGGGFGTRFSNRWNGLTSQTQNLRRPIQMSRLSKGKETSDNSEGQSSHETNSSHRDGDSAGAVQEPALPAPVASPINRADTASTVYRVRYHPITEPTPPILEATPEDRLKHDLEQQLQANERSQRDSTSNLKPVLNAESTLTSRVLSNSMSWMLHPFRRPRDSPPLEVTQAISSNPQLSTTRPPVSNSSNNNGSSLLRRLHFKKSLKPEIAPTGVIVVPAPQRRQLISDSYGDPNNEAGEQVQLGIQGACSRSNNDANSPSQRNSPPDAVLRAMNSPPLSPSSSQRSSQIVAGPMGHGNVRTSARNTPMISEREEQYLNDGVPERSTPAEASSSGSASERRRRTDHDR